MSNENLTREKAVELIKGRDLKCPKCDKAYLLPRYSYKQQNTEFKCPLCNEIYHPCKLI